MIYLRNITSAEQWLEDPQTGIKRRVEPDALTRVVDSVADHMLATQPDRWARVVAIALAPPASRNPGELP